MSKYKLSISLLCSLVLGVLLLCGQSIGIEIAHAAAGQNVEGNVGELLVGVMQLAGALSVGLQVLLMVALWFLQFLMSSDFFSNAAMMEALNNIWTLSRDIMNLIFAILLIGVAFYTIIVAKGDFVKEKIVTFIVAVILVNFSWFFPRVILDISAVLTATVTDIPARLPGYTCMALDDKDNDKRIPCRVIVNITLLPTNDDQWNYADMPGGDCLTGIACWQLVDMSSPMASELTRANKMINGLMVSFGRVHGLAKVPDGTIALGKGGVELLKVSLQLMVSLFFVLFFQVAMVFPLLGLAVGLFLRILILWATMAFMPFAFIGYVVSGKLGTNVFGLEDYIWENFISAAFLPVFVAIPFTIGMIMLTTVTTIDPAALGDIAGKMVINYPIINGVRTWWALLWMVAATMIIYVGAFAALSRNKLIGGFTDKIKDYGRMIGSAAMQLPLLAPIPLPGGKGASLGSLMNLPREASSKIRALTQAPILGDKLGGLPGGGSGGAGATAEASAKLLDANKTNTDRIIAELVKLENMKKPEDRKAQIEVIRTVTSDVSGGKIKLEEGKELEQLANIARESRKRKINDSLAKELERIEGEQRKK